MPPIVKKEKRNVIPRWRSFHQTLALGELARSPKDLPSTEDGQLEKRVWEWKRDRTIWHASDLVSCAFILQQPDLAREAAEFILTARNAPVAAVSLASTLLNRNTDAAQTEAGSENTVDAHQAIHRARERLREDPRNAIQWVDLAAIHGPWRGTEGPASDRHSSQPGAKQSVRSQGSVALLRPPRRRGSRTHDAEERALHENRPLASRGRNCPSIRSWPNVEVCKTRAEALAR